MHPVIGGVAERSPFLSRAVRNVFPGFCLIRPNSPQISELLSPSVRWCESRRETINPTLEGEVIPATVQYQTQLDVQ